MLLHCVLEVKQSVPQSTVPCEISKLMENNIAAYWRTQTGGRGGLECCCCENVTFWVVLLTVAKNVNFRPTPLGL